MISHPFDISLDIFYKNVYSGIICFFILAALAIILINPAMVFFLVMFMTTVLIELNTPQYKTGYLAVALSVCKNE